MRVSSCIRWLLIAFVMLAMSAASFAQIGIFITTAPPALPVYQQPPVPGEGYIWTPGYWAYADNDYYWVPGTWVMAPEVGFLWTPGYWGWGDNRYLFHDGYWGPRVGFYGGINYGYGYFGHGYEGGRWDRGRFFYNRSVNNVNVTNIHNVYNTTVINRTTVNRVSYNGGRGGINERPRREEEVAARERHLPPVAAQTEHVQAARANLELRASANHGKPPVAATPRPGAFQDREVVPAKEAGAPYNPAGNRAAAKPRPSAPDSHADKQAAPPVTARRSTPAPRNDVPRPPSETKKASPPNREPPSRPVENAAQREKMSPPEKTPHPGAPRRPEPTPETAHQAGNAPRPPSQARPEAAPRPQAEAHPQGGPQQGKQTHPEDRPPK